LLNDDDLSQSTVIQLSSISSGKIPHEDCKILHSYALI
jgi:hypothetical protein